MQKTVIHWFRQDLRVRDNPALHGAAKNRILPIYILDDVNAGRDKMGTASRWWLQNSLKSLDESLDGHLSIYAGDPLDILRKLIKKHQITEIYWNRCYEPWRIKRDKTIKIEIERMGVGVHSFNGSLLWEPWDVHKDDGTPYKVFTPFYKNGCLKAKPPRALVSKPRAMEFIKSYKENITQPHSLELNNHWHVGEQAALKKAKKFFASGLKNYKKGRDFPALESVSRLSPHLHFGEISPHQIWKMAQDSSASKDLDHFLSELGWREFSYSLLYHFRHLPRENFQSKFDAFPWKKNKTFLEKWQRGETGYPIVDAGMRELLETGYMHNRVRMIVGSFLVKNLMIDWREGEKWFWDRLVDADLASNSASWQWVAGCGADAAPYFRIFNPVTQGEKFDPDGDYTRRFVPELCEVPDKYLFKPWEFSEELDYPDPIVDLRESRESALEAFASIKTTSNV